MPTAGPFRVHRASNVSDAVPRRIAHAGVDALRVQSIYRSVLNITTADGLLTVASPEGGGLPNGVLADLGPDWRAIGLSSGMVVYATDASIRVPDAGLEIRLDAASRWSPRLQSSAETAHSAMARWGRRTAATRTIAQARASAGGFGALLGDDVSIGPAGILGVSWLVTRLSRGRLRPPVGWAAVTAGGTIAGLGFTVALLIAALAFTGQDLEEAKLGILGAAGGAAVLTWVTLRATDLMPKERRERALLGAPNLLSDLAAPVDPDRDHIRGPRESAVTVVEYGDFECPYCGRAEPIVRELLGDFADVRYVWRHLPLNDVHQHAQRAAEAAEAAADQGAFWEMHDKLLHHQDALEDSDLIGYADDLDLDLDRFSDHLSRGRGSGQIADDVEGADLSGVSGTPTFFINGRRHYGAYDIDTLSRAVRAAGARARVAATTG